MSINGSATASFNQNVSSPLHWRLLGNDPQIQEINSFIKELTDIKLTVFISGETGTGKDIVAKLIHGPNVTRQRPFIKLNCPGIPEDSLDSELFGHEKGAFTGAHVSRPGQFESACDGTVFLDELSETSHKFQSKILHLLDGEPFMRIGGEVPIPMNARIISASSVPLDVAVADGRLRNDMAFRLNETVIHLPPLRERRDDIPLLAEHFNFHACKSSGKDYKKLDPAVLETMQDLDWPGNVRELAARVNEMVIAGSYQSMDAIDISANPDSSEPRFTTLAEARTLALEQAEKKLIEDMLRHTLWNRRKAAELLDTSYSSILRRIAKYNIGKP
jgi:Nif-specific regulatory protein